MSEVRLREDFPFTPEWYEGRARAPHWEQPVHRDRLHAALLLAELACRRGRIDTVLDVGCGDGGLLAALGARHPAGEKSGVDISAEAVKGAWERGVTACCYDATDPSAQVCADLVICTEVLEHLDDPHGFLSKLRCDFLVASSPFGETPESHDACHVWAWDREGYGALLAGAGFVTVEHLVVGEDARFQVLLAVKP